LSDRRATALDRRGHHENRVGHVVRPTSDSTGSTWSPRKSCGPRCPTDERQHWIDVVTTKIVVVTLSDRRATALIDVRRTKIA
jgi:hypothetical protein